MIRDSIFLAELDSVRGRIFFNGPLGFFGCCRGVITASPTALRCVLVSKQEFMSLLYSVWKAAPPYLRSSFCTPSGPVALLFFSALAAAATSTGVIGASSGRGTPMNGARGGSLCSFVNWHSNQVLSAAAFAVSIIKIEIQ